MAFQFTFVAGNLTCLQKKILIFEIPTCHIIDLRQTVNIDLYSIEKKKNGTNSSVNIDYLNIDINEIELN